MTEGQAKGLASQLEATFRYKYEPDEKKDLITKLTRISVAAAIHAIKEIESDESIRHLPAPVIVIRKASSYREKANSPAAPMPEPDHGSMSFKMFQAIWAMMASGKCTHRQVIGKCYEADKARPGVGYHTCAVNMQRRAERGGYLDEVVEMGGLFGGVF